MKHINLGIAAALLLFASNWLQAKTIEASAENATLAFAGEHAGMKFEGVFGKWQSTLVLPPQADPSISAQFTLSSAKTGDSSYDETLPEEDWFNVADFPTARFESTSIESVAEGYEVKGQLTLKGVSQPVRFMLADDQTTLNAAFEIDRLAHGIGVESDPDAEWVSRMISMTLTINKP